MNSHMLSIIVAALLGITVTSFRGQTVDTRMIGLFDVRAFNIDEMEIVLVKGTDVLRVGYQQQDFRLSMRRQPVSTPTEDKQSIGMQILMVIGTLILTLIILYFAFVVIAYIAPIALAINGIMMLSEGKVFYGILSILGAIVALPILLFVHNWLKSQGRGSEGRRVRVERNETSCSGSRACPDCDRPEMFMNRGDGKCSACHGSGNSNIPDFIPGQNEGNCYRCKGSGVCPTCGGRGEI